MSLRVVVIEDEPLARERLCDLLGQCGPASGGPTLGGPTLGGPTLGGATPGDPALNIIGTFGSVEESVQFFQSKTADLVFLDIQLSDGLSFEIFRQVEVNAPIIFTTAYDQYALQAFKVNSLDYLLKPIDLKDLQAALAKFHKHNVPLLDQTLLQQVYQQLIPSHKTRFLVRIGDHYQSKPVPDIAYLYADGKTTYMVLLSDRRRYILDYTLETLDEQLLDPKLFFRINRKFMVHIAAIREVQTYANGRLKVLLNIPVEMDMIVSRERVIDFKTWLNS